MTNAVTNATPSSTLLATMNGTTTDKSAAQAAQDQFMTLLVTQMKNQDPLNPMDNAQMTSQLAQLSTVSGIDKVNTSLQTFMSNFQSAQSLQAANMIGHGVLVAGSNVSLSQGKSIFGINLPNSASQVTATISDASGKAIKTINLGNQAAGVLPFAWDGSMDSGGTAPDGTYKLSVSATNGASKVDATALSFGTVSSVSSNSKGISLITPNLGDVAMTDVQLIL